MRFKLGMVIAASLAILLTGCTDETGQQPDRAEDNTIGTKLVAMSSVTSEAGADQEKIAMYDASVCRIHQFDMTTSKYMRSLKPVYKGGDHKVLFDPAGNYVIDLVQTHLTIFDTNGFPQDPQLNFVGNPTNGSFRPGLGYLVMQDDVKTVGMVQINAQGTVVGRWPLGQIVHDDVSVVAGDIDDSGRLFLALNDDTIAIVDMTQSIAQKKWVVTSTFPSGLTKVNWVATIHDQPNQILVKTSDQNGTVNPTLAIIDVSAKTVKSTYAVDSGRNVVKTSKSFDPHFIVKDQGRLMSSNATLVYPQGGTLHQKTLPDQMRNVLSSYLNLNADSWSFVDSDSPNVLIGGNWVTGWFLYDDPNAATTGRQLKRYSLSSLLAVTDVKIPDNTQVQVSQNYLFQLYSSALGKAQSFQVSNSGVQEIKGFNQQFLHHDPCSN